MSSVAVVDVARVFLVGIVWNSRSQMCYATRVVTVGWSADCLAWRHRTAQRATKMFRNHIHSASKKHKSSKYLLGNSSSISQ